MQQAVMQMNKKESSREMKKKKKMNEKDVKKLKGENNSLFSFKALKRQINGFGFNYSFFDYAKSIIFYAVIIFILAYLHRLKIQYILINILLLIVMMPFMVYSQYQYMNEQQNFSDLCIYLKQMINNFRQYKKVLAALKQTQQSFSKNSLMYKDVDKAIKAIEGGQSIADAFKFIEADFYNSYVNQLHSYLILGEKEGGDIIYQALYNIDYNEWETDTYSFQTAVQRARKANGIFVGGSLGMSLFIYMYLPDLVTKNLFPNMTYQIYTFIYIMLMLVSFIFVRSFVKFKWINRNE